MTELSWLCDLLLHHDLPPKTKKHIIKRISHVEQSYNRMPMPTVPHGTIPVVQGRIVNGAMQSASTIALMEKHAGAPISVPATINPMASTIPIQEGTVVASKEAAGALLKRQEAIASLASADPFSGKPEPGRSSPRKW